MKTPLKRRGIAAAILAMLSCATSAWGAGDGLRLEEARITARLLPGGSLEVSENVTVHSDRPVTRGRIEHRISLAPGDGVSRMNARSAEGALRLEMGGSKPEDRLWVVFETEVETRRFSYRLDYTVSAGDANSHRYALVVPFLPPQDPHDPVTLMVGLPSGQEVTGRTFPNLEAEGEVLVGRMGGVPSFLSVPLGERGSGVWLVRHLVDLVVLAGIAISAGVWVRFREAGATREPGEGR